MRHHHAIRCGQYRTCRQLPWHKASHRWIRRNRRKGLHSWHELTSNRDYRAGVQASTQNAPTGTSATAGVLLLVALIPEIAPPHRKMLEMHLQKVETSISLF